MSGALTVQRFHEVEAARIAGQIEMRTRIAKWMRASAEMCRNDRDRANRPFAKLFAGMADEVETIDPK